MMITTTLADVVEKVQASILHVRGVHGIETALAFRDGLILTTAHAISETITISNLDGKDLEVELVGIDPRLDLAVFTTDSTLQSLPVAKKTRVGDVVLTIGSDGAKGPRISWGLVSAIGDDWLTPKGAKVEHWIDVDASLPWGSSGGALVNTQGELIGLNTHGVIRGGTTLSVETLDKAISKIQESGSVVPGWLGVKVHEADLPKSQCEELGQEKGMLILRVWGAAKKGGLQIGDILVGVDDGPISSYLSFKSELSGSGGQEKKIKFLRSGEVHEQVILIDEKKTKRRKWFAKCR